MTKKYPKCPELHLPKIEHGDHKSDPNKVRDMTPLFPFHSTKQSIVEKQKEALKDAFCPKSHTEITKDGKFKVTPQGLLIHHLKEKVWELEAYIHGMKKMAEQILSKIKVREDVKQTNQYALFSCDKNGTYHFQNIINIDEEDTEMEYDEETVLLMRLPDHNTLPEHEGF